MVRRQKKKSYPKPKIRKKTKCSKISKRSKVSKKSKSQIIHEKEQRTSNVMNLGKIMRKYSNGMKVSPSAVRAMAERFDLFLEISMPQITEISKAHECKMVKEVEDLERPERSQAHITWFFSLASNKIENIAQLKRKYHWELVKNNNNNKVD